MIVWRLGNLEEELEKSIHPTYANTLKNYIKLKIEMLDWFPNLMKSIKSELKGVDNNARVFRSLINNEIKL